MKRHFPFVLVLLFLCAFTLRAFLAPGYFKTHDGDFHLIRLDHFVNEMSRGQFPVRIGTELAEGYGYPAFNYFYPLPYLAGSLPRLAGWPLGESVKLVTVISTIGSVLACYWWLLRHSGRFGAFVGATLYLLAPYRFVSLLVTGQIGTIMAFLWMPLVLISVYEVLVRNDQRKYVALGAVAVAGLILSHINTLILFSPVLMAYAAALSLTQRPARKSLWWWGLSLCLGLAMAAFYLLPSLLEKHLVQMGSTVFVKYSEHWPTFKQLLYSAWGYGYSETGPGDGMSFQIGFAQWGVFGLSSIALAWSIFLQKKWRPVLLPAVFLVVFVVCVFLMLPASDSIWRLAQPMQYLQYPWRWLSVVVLSASFLTAWLSQQRYGKILGVLVLGLALFNNRNYLRSWETIRYPDSFYLENSTLYRGSTDISWEALPIGVDSKKMPPQFSSSLIATTSATATTLHTFYLPHWEVTVNGKKVPTSSNEDGWLTVPAVTSNSVIEVTVVQTPLEMLANSISVMAILITLVISLRDFKSPVVELRSPKDKSRSSGPRRPARE